MEDSDHQSTESGALVGSNDDLLTEILLRLPATSILRFKSVSKHWRWLLTHRRFTLRYDNLSKSPGIFARNTYVPINPENQSSPPFSSLDFNFDSRGINILQSCNGLLLCRSNARWNSLLCQYYVFNPTTKQLAVIPSLLRGQAVQKIIPFIGLAFHQTDCVHYKIVCILSLDPEGKSFQIQIYSSDTGKWKISIQSFAAHKQIFHTGVYWNGAMHWAPSYGSHLYFDIETEQLQMLPLPVEMMSPKTFTMYFGESRGHLHLIPVKTGEDTSLHVNVYEMMSDHSGWFVKYQVDLDQQLPTAFPEMVYTPSGYDFSVIDVVRGDKEEDTFMVLLTPRKMIRYNVHDNSFKKIFNLTKSERYASFHRYTETLTSF